MTEVGVAGRVGPSSTRSGPRAAAWWLSEHPRVADAALAAVAFGTAVVALSDGPRGDQSPSGTAAILVALTAGALVVRRISPLAVWAVTTTLTAVAVLLGGVDPTLVAPLLVALYTVGRWARLRTTAACVLVTGLAYALALSLARGAWLDERGDSLALPVLALVGAAAAVGVAVRSQRDALEAAQARAQQAEVTREEEAVRRVTDERLRIARELHDVVAHHISVINVQAGVARHLLDTHPDQAHTALTAVRDASKTVLTEMAAVVGLLRTEDGQGPAEPAPGMHRLGALVNSVRAAGLAVTWRTTGEVVDLPPIADLAAYRVIQESLTNAVKYGRGTADLLVHHSPGEIVIEVRNPLAAGSPASASGGHGLIGMRERLEAVAGHLSAGPDGAGDWLVHAVVPRRPQ